MTGDGMLLVMAHPALERSRVNQRMFQAAQEVAGVTLHDLYEVYPDFTIDVRAEQKRLLDHAVIGLQFPLYWYSAPALLKEWLDLVWLYGFAYGQGGAAMRGKRLFVACTTGARAEAYGPNSYNTYTIGEFLRPLEQTARLCGMAWEKPFVLHASGTKTERTLQAGADAYRRRLAALAALAVRTGPERPDIAELH
ncbi:MAG: oxidoreductase [Caulobacteraceae bacterium]|jgi:glutathione-regulated potassium-efflux system ancillary protein KefG|nr:oxidoreductase [Caulobacteraceae bacterium]